MIGAAADMAILHLSRPSARRTFLNTRTLAIVQPHGVDPL